MLDKEMLVVDIVEKFPAAEKVFKQYEEKTGSCIMCSHLFNTLEAVSKDYNLNLDELLNELKKAVENSEN